MLASIGLVANAYADETVEACKDELSKQINELLRADNGEVIIKAATIASLKLNLKMLNSNASRVTLEEHIQQKLKDLKRKDPASLYKKIKSLYRKFGQSKTNQEVEQILNGLTKHNYFPRSKRLSNKESAVIMMAYELFDPDPTEYSINENDVAITWFMDEVDKKANQGIRDTALTNRLKTSVKVAHASGVFKQNRALNSEELKKSIRSYDRSIKSKLAKLINDFKAEYSFCYHVLGGNKCIKEIITPIYQNNLAELTQELKASTMRSKKVGNLKVQLLDNLTLNLKSSIVSAKNASYIALEEKGAKPSVKPPRYPDEIPEKVNGDRPGSCNGIDYESQIRNVTVHSIDPLRAGSMLLNGALSGTFRDQVGQGVGSITGINKVLKRFCPRVPLGPLNFRCYPYVKLFRRTTKKAEALVCCEELKWQPYENKFVSFTGGIEIKGFLGLPDYIPFVVAEIGLLGGASITYSNGGGYTPEGCGDKDCAVNALRLSAYIGVYGDLGLSKKKWSRGGNKKADRMPAGLGVEGKVSWRPNAIVRQCSYPNGKVETPKITLDSGKGFINVTVYVGWVYSYDYYKELWDSAKKDTFDFPVF